MAHCNTVLSQILKLVPRHEIDSLAKEHHSGRAFRVASRWAQFVTLMIGQLSGRISLRDIVDNLSAQSHRLYHLGSKKLSRSTLSRINESKPYTLYEALFGKLLQRCQSMAPAHKFRFKNPLYSLDASTIDLCLSVFPWADFRSTKGAIKLHVGLNHNGHIPEFITVTEGTTSDIEVGRKVNFPKGSIVAIDRGYNDYTWFNSLNSKGIYFVTRLKTNAKIRIVDQHKLPQGKGLTSDKTIEFSGKDAAKKCPIKLRRIGYKDSVTGKHYVFLTNNFKLSAKTIADIYKSRWDVELFFKWIKQNLKIKSFIGTSKNAVLTQIWIAMCAYLLLAFLRFKCHLDRSMQQILRLLQLNLFEKRDLMALLRGDPIEDPLDNSPQMNLI